MFPPDEPFGGSGFGYGGEDDPYVPYTPGDDPTYPYLDPESDPDWFGNEVTIEDGYGNLVSHTLEEWKEIVLLEAWEIEWLYDLDNLSIIYELERQGYWDDMDWEEWRVAYDRVH